MDPLAHPYLLLGGVLITFYLWNKATAAKSNPNGLPLPPGPKGLPFIGSFLDVSKDNSWLQYDQWSKIYGNITDLSHIPFIEFYAP